MSEMKLLYTDFYSSKAESQMCKYDYSEYAKNKINHDASSKICKEVLNENALLVIPFGIYEIDRNDYETLLRSKIGLVEYPMNYLKEKNIHPYMLSLMLEQLLNKDNFVEVLLGYSTYLPLINNNNPDPFSPPFDNRVTMEQHGEYVEMQPIYSPAMDDKGVRKLLGFVGVASVLGRICCSIVKEDDVV